MLKRIVVGYDFSEYSEDALAWAVDLARPLGAQVALVHVVAAEKGDEAAVEAARKQLVTVADDMGAEVVSHVLAGASIADALVAFAEQCDGDLLVVGTRGLGAVARMLLGSVADTLVRKATCPVVTMRHEE